MNSKKSGYLFDKSPSLNVFAFFLLIIFSNVNLIAQNTQAGQGVQKPAANQQAKPSSAQPRVLRAPDVIPGTLPEMRDPSYWISRMKNPDVIVLSLAEIQARNNDYFLRMKNLNNLNVILEKQINQELVTRPGLLSSIPDIETMTPAEISAFTSDMLGKGIRTLNGPRRSVNILGIPYSDQEIKSIETEMAFNEIDKQIIAQPGISVKNTRLRIIPAIRPEYVGSTSWDMWNFDILPVGCPIQILHISKTGGFLYVLSDRGIGWVNAEDIAISSKEKIDKFTNTQDFIICTGERVPYFSDPQCRYVSGWFRMGDRLPSKGNNPRQIQIPTRQINGKLLVQTAWLTVDSDVHRGYLPYTRKNVALQAFKILDLIYDWTGGWYGRDHATQLRDIFSVFGFKFPSMGGMLSAYSVKPKFVYPKDGKEAQYKAILSNEPFLTIQICSSGHSMLFIGEHNGEPIVFDTHGYRYNDADGNELVIRRANVGTIALPDYFLKQDITFVELK